MGAGSNYAIQQLGLERSKLSTNDTLEERKKRSDSTNPDEVKRIKECYDNNSTVIANIKSVKKDGLERRVMRDSLVKIHQRYKEKTGSNVSYTTFRELRPSNYMLVDKAKLLQCLCEICENTRLQIEALGKLKYSNILTPYNMSDAMLCSVDNIKCAVGTCTLCGCHKLDDAFGSWSSKELKQTIKYNSWQLVDKCKQCIEVVSTVGEVIEDLKYASHMVALHIFDAKHQYQQFKL